MKLSSISLIALVALIMHLPVSAKGTLEIKAIPHSLKQDVGDSKVSIKGESLIFQPQKGTDFFTNSDASQSTLNAPKLLFQPKGDFILHVKVTPKFTKPFDGGAVLVYASDKYWAKLLFERFTSGENGVASTVSKIAGDDAYHYRTKNKTLYLKLVRKESTYIFYFSDKGNHWNYIRSFTLPTDEKAQIGFAAQAPLSDQFQVEFSEIKYQEKTMEDFWQGK